MTITVKEGTRNRDVYLPDHAGAQTITVASASTEIFDDDGESYSYPNAAYLMLNVAMQCTTENVALTIKKSGSFVPAYKALTLCLPAGETRPLF